MKAKPHKREWPKATPEQFERTVISYLESLRSGLQSFSIHHRLLLGGPDGEFEIDALARFEALGAEFLVVVECKHHRSPIKRETVQVVRDRVRSLSAHKGMLFSTGGFQSGAISYAKSQKITLVYFANNGPIYETKGLAELDKPHLEEDAIFQSSERRNLVLGSHTVTAMIYS